MPEEVTTLDADLTNRGYTEALGEHATNPEQPRTSGETILALGQEWTVSSCENRIKAQFEQWVRTNAKRIFLDEENPEEQRKMREAYVSCMASGYFNWDGKSVREALFDVPGMRYMLYLLLGRCHKDITEETCFKIMREAGEQVGIAIGWAMGNLASPKKEGEV